MKHIIQSRVPAVVAVALLLLAVAAVAAGFRVGQTRAAPSVSPAVAVSVIDADCPASVMVTSVYSKISDIGTFTVQSPDSTVELAFYGRLYALSTTGTGVIYELRVDDEASTVGRIQANLKTVELGTITGRQAPMGGFFQGLAPGEHTVSMWARASGHANTATNVMYDPGCWSTDHVTVKEYLPFGTIAVPAVIR